MGAVIALAVWARFGPWAAAAFVAGAAWCLANLHVLRLLAGMLGRPARKLRIAALLFLKMPVLYAAGYLLFATRHLPAIGLLGGFGWPLAVIILKAAGRLMLGLDGSQTVARSAGRARRVG